MGRLLRKKTTVKKKKLKESEDKAETSLKEKKEDSVFNRLAAVTTGNIKKKQILPFFKKITHSIKPSSKGYSDKIAQFLREVKVELKKVTWPSRKQAMGSTIVVLILVFLISFFLGMVDIALSNLIKLVFR